MKYRRYGKFHFFDYTIEWFAIVLLLAVGIGGFLIDTQFHLSILPILISVVIAWSIYKPNRECFILDDDKITIITGKKSKTMVVHRDATCIIAYADICPPLSKQIGSLKSYTLKDRFSIIILKPIISTELLKRLHQNHTYGYFNTTVEMCVGDAYMYSFVGTQELLNQLLATGIHQVVVPESLIKRVSISEGCTVIVDKGF